MVFDFSFTDASRPCGFSFVKQSSYLDKPMEMNTLSSMKPPSALSCLNESLYQGKSYIATKSCETLAIINIMQRVAFIALVSLMSGIC